MKLDNYLELCINYAKDKKKNGKFTKRSFKNGVFSSATKSKEPLQRVYEPKKAIGQNFEKE